MRQLLQNARTGEIEVAEVPAPRVLPGCVLVRMAASLVSAGTERASSEFAAKNLLQKARSRPDLVREVVNKVRRDGIVAAVAAVRGRLDQPLSLGYSSAGTIVEAGEGITDLKPGDRVACAGAGFAVHGEFACVPRLLVARIPSSKVDFESAAFTTLGAVAIHGVRTAEVSLGDTVAVIGLGLLGQLTLQILKAAGCRVIGIDLLEARAQLAQNMGAAAVSTSAAEFCDLCLNYSNGRGVDAVLITAETASSDPVNLAARVARDRAIVTAVGTVGMEIERKLYYEKELDFRVSRSYGPGRYDTAYEQKGRDYPIGHVRWTEARNMEAFLQLLDDGKLDLQALISHRFDIEAALDAYDLIRESSAAYLGVLITYPSALTSRLPERRLEVVAERREARSSDAVRIGVIGSGNFAHSTLIPAIRRDAATVLTGVCASTGARARAAAKKFGFAFAATDPEEIYRDPEIDTVVIATRHHSHAEHVIRALEAGKNVFCEKPLCLTEDELEEIQRAHARHGGKLMTGFNRRFAPLAQEMKSFLREWRGPLVSHYRVNAGPLPQDHWINDPEQGGGRVLGEMCHFVDFLTFLAGCPVSLDAHCVTTPAGQDVIATFEFEDGSLGTVSYLCNGDRAFSKERIEVFGGGRVAALDDFRRLDLVHHGKKRTIHSRFRQDKGHVAEWRAFSESIRKDQTEPIPFQEIRASTLATIRLAEALRHGDPGTTCVENSESFTAPLVS